ncbi:MAG: hypothetical protein FH761_05885 [Firmicutes bacterium]|nr:hypothetical protein [Bacillota bacterium]
MKCYIKSFKLNFLLLVCIFTISCSVQMDNYDKKSDSNIKDNLIEEDTNEDVSSKLISDEDFIVTDGKNTIVLDTPYKDFEISKEEIELQNNYVGEIPIGDYVYKYYIHKFEDFNIYVSNAYYDRKNRDFNEYFISQINLENNNFKTARGISLDSTYDDIIELYGEGTKEYQEGSSFIIYRLDDKELSFEIDENRNIKNITLRVIVE